MGHVLVGVDGSSAAGAALRWAGRLAASSGADVVALHSVRHPWAEMDPGDEDALTEERRSMVAGWTDAAHVDARPEVQVGDARQLLAHAARPEDVDLLVLGRRGNGPGPGLLHVSSVVEHAAHHVDVPLAVIPAESEPTRRIVLGVDGSPTSQAAVRWATEAARALGVGVLAVTVEEALVEWTASTDERNWRHVVEHELDQWTAVLREAGLDVTTQLVEELYPVDGLLAAAADAGDLLVVGARGAHGFTGLRVGGVALQLLHRARVPVVLVPAA